MCSSQRTVDREGAVGPQPEGGQSGSCPPEIKKKRVYLLGTAIGYIIFPPENISWLRPWGAVHKIA